MLTAWHSSLAISLIGSLGVASASLATNDCSQAHGSSESQLSHPESCGVGDDDQQQALDAVMFFDELVDRYRRMTAYKDTVSVVQVIHDGLAEPNRVESELACTFDEHGLYVSTPASDFSRMFSTALPLRISPPLTASQLHHAVWLAPHMSLRFDTEPLRRNSRSPVKPVGARTTKIEDHTVVQLRLSSRPTDESTAPQHPSCDDLHETETTFDLFVNPDSMLIERIETDETLPDGRQQKTTVHIQPLHSASDSCGQGRWLEAGEESSTSSDVVAPAQPTSLGPAQHQMQDPVTQQ